VFASSEFIIKRHRLEYRDVSVLITRVDRSSLKLFPFYVYLHKGKLNKEYLNLKLKLKFIAVKSYVTLRNIVEKLMDTQLHSFNYNTQL